MRQGWFPADSLDMLPIFSKPVESFPVEVNNLPIVGVRFGHIRPEGMTCYRTEIELLPGIPESIFNRSMPVGDITVVVNIAEIGFELFIRIHIAGP